MFFSLNRNIIWVFSLLLIIHTSGMSQPSTGSPVNFHPIQYDNGPSYDNTTHAYISIDMAPTATIKYFNLRIINPITEMPEWKVKNLPVPVFDLDHTLFTRINTEGYMEGYTGLMGEYSITSEWIMDQISLPSM